MESEQLLDRVPEVIGEGAPESGAPSSEPGAPGDPDVTVGVVLSPINPEDVRKYLEEGHDWVADFLSMEHWRLTPRQSQMLGGPLAQVLQSVSDELTNFLPAFLREWVARTPGAAGLLIALGLVEVPKVVVTFRIWQQRAKEAREARNSRPVGTRHQPPQPQPVGSVVGPKSETKNEPPDEKIPPRSSGINWN